MGWRCRLQPSGSPGAADDRIGLDLDQHVRVDERRDLDHRRRRTDRSEDLAMRSADRFPLGDVGDVHARAHDVADRRAGLVQRAHDVGERLASLRVGVANADDLAVAPRGGRAGDVHGVADANGARVADDRLPWSSGRDQGSFFVAHLQWEG